MEAQDTSTTTAIPSKTAPSPLETYTLSTSQEPGGYSAMALSQVCVDFPGFWTSGYQFNIRPYAHRCLTSPVHLTTQRAARAYRPWEQNRMVILKPPDLFPEAHTSTNTALEKLDPQNPNVPVLKKTDNQELLAWTMNILENTFIRHHPYSRPASHRMQRHNLLSERCQKRNWIRQLTRQQTEPWWD